MLIRIIKDWHFPDVMRQTPGCSGRWGEYTFTLDPLEEVDFVIVLNRVPVGQQVSCPAEHIWLIIQEPPVREYYWLRAGYADFSKVFTADQELQGGKYIHSQLGLPWHVNKSYDELKRIPVFEKTRKLSWVTSSATGRSGRARRMVFLDKIMGKVDFDLWGRGFSPIDDKWNGIAPYQYSFAIENSAGPYYWTEKLADCFLSWTMPVYYGCTNILNYFPSESMVLVDIEEPEEAVQIIQEAIFSEKWKKNFEALEHARNLVLDHYQLFPLIAEAIAAHGCSSARKVSTYLPELPYLYNKGKVKRIGSYLKRYIRKRMNTL